MLSGYSYAIRPGTDKNSSRHTEWKNFQAQWKRASLRTILWKRGSIDLRQYMDTEETFGRREEDDGKIDELTEFQTTAQQNRERIFRKDERLLQLIRYFLFATSILIGLISCQNDVLVSQEWKWDQQQWITGDIKTMQIEAADTTSRYAMDLDLSWDKSFAFENLYIRTLTKFPSGKEVTSVTSLELEETDGTWAGVCSGNTCSLTFPLQKVFTFPETGTYSWSIEPFMRVDTVPGINSLGVTCRKLKK